jgi:SAM-dependent methyltransferase
MADREPAGAAGVASVAGPGTVAASYDLVAGEYARRIGGELAHKPLDRALLAELAARTRGRGRVCDLGCGPGHVTAFLRERGADVVGLDLSAGMVAQARQRYPGVEFRVADMLRLGEPDGSFAGVAAFYSVIHLLPGQLATALSEVRRVLIPGGLLLLAFHVGTEIRHFDEWWGQQVSLDFRFFEVAQLLAQASAAGLTVRRVIERDPDPDVEVATRRCYLWAERATMRL